MFHHIYTVFFNLENFLPHFHDWDLTEWVYLITSIICSRLILTLPSSPDQKVTQGADGSVTINREQMMKVIKYTPSGSSFPFTVGLPDVMDPSTPASLCFNHKTTNQIEEVNKPTYLASAKQGNPVTTTTTTTPKVTEAITIKHHNQCKMSTQLMTPFSKFISVPHCDQTTPCSRHQNL